MESILGSHVICKSTKKEPLSPQRGLGVPRGKLSIDQHGVDLIQSTHPKYNTETILKGSLGPSLSSVTQGKIHVSSANYVMFETTF